MRRRFAPTLAFIGFVLVLSGCSCHDPAVDEVFVDEDGAVVFGLTFAPIGSATYVLAADGTIDADPDRVRPDDPRLRRGELYRDCFDGWCAETMPSQWMRVTNPSGEVIEVWTDKSPRASIGISGYCSRPRVADFVWFDEPSADGPTLWIALGEDGAGRWRPDEGLSYLPVGDIERIGKYDGITPSATLVVIFLTPPFLLASFLLGLAGFAIRHRGQRRIRPRLWWFAAMTFGFWAFVVLVAELVAVYRVARDEAWSTWLWGTVFGVVLVAALITASWGRATQPPPPAMPKTRLLPPPPPPPQDF